jgi:hypothetical protein
MAINLVSPTPGQTSTPVGGDKTKGVIYAKDYNLIAINLLAGQFITLDLKPSMVELSYFEDLYNNSVSGQVMISDAQGYIEKLGMHGNEYIRLAFGKDDNPNIRIDKLFRVYKISPRQKSTGFDSETYAIYFCSDEFVLSEQYRVSKSYVDKQISYIVNDILTVYIKAPEHKYNLRNIELTKGIYSIIVPNFKPFEAINWLARYALPGEYGNVGADMLFFENAEGYNFSSLQSLFKKRPYQTYHYRPKNIKTEDYGDPGSSEMFNVLGYELIDSFNIIEGISSGMFANRLLTIDTLLRRYEITDFNYMDYHNKAKTLNSNPIVNNLQNRFGQTVYDTPEGCYKLTTTNKNQSKVDYIKKRPESVTKDAFVETIFSQRKSQLALTNYTRMKLYVAGDPNLTVGMTINFNMLSQDPASEKDPKVVDKYYSGKYLITAVRHIIQTGAYNTVVEVVKDSLPNNYSVVDNSRPIYKATVSGVKK